MTVAMNMAAVARVENPRRLSNFEGSDLDKKIKSSLQEGKNEHKDNNRCREEYKEQSYYQTCG